MTTPKKEKGGSALALAWGTALVFALYERAYEGYYDYPEARQILACRLSPLPW